MRSASLSARPGVGKPDPAPFRYYERLNRVRMYAELRYSSDISLADAARVAGLEPTSFSRYFHQKTGLCFRDWMAQVRVEHAQELLRASDLSISETAARVGYHSLRTFERHFRRCVGCAPSAFKASVRPS